MTRKQSAPSVSFFAFQDIITSVVGIFVLITLIMMVELASRSVSSSSSGRQVADTLSASVATMQAELDMLGSKLKELQSLDLSSPQGKGLTAEERQKQLEKELQEIEERSQRFEAIIEKSNKAIVSAEGRLDKLREQSVENELKKDSLKKLLGKLEQLKSSLDSLQTEKPLVFRSTTVDGKPVIVLDLDVDEIRLLDLAKESRNIFRGNDMFKRMQDWVREKNVGSFHFLLIVRPKGESTFSACRAFLESSRASYGYDVISASRAIKTRGELGAQ